MDLTNKTVEELKALRNEVGAELKARTESARADEKVAKTDREAEFKGTLNEGDTIRFLFNKEEREDVIVRANEKSVSVEIDGKIKYVKYANVLAIVAKAEKAEEAKAEEADEAVA